jgi:pimeloyl-ACP methyl ester carboxylesterase
VENIQVPTAIFVGSQDTMSSPADSEWLREAIPNVIEFNTYDYECLTFVVGRYMGYLNDLQRILDEYTTVSSE